MSSVARIVVPGVAHHIMQRGNRKSNIFETDDDRLAYPRFLKQYTANHHRSIYACGLMTNHIHLMSVPAYEMTLGRPLRDAHTVYAMYFNMRRRLTGHVWQGRFCSCPLDEAHLWATVCYAARNPVAAGLVQRADHYRWWSAAAHGGLCADGLLCPDSLPAGIINDWCAWLSQPDEESAADGIRRQTRTGHPAAASCFLSNSRD